MPSHRRFALMLVPALLCVAAGAEPPAAYRDIPAQYDFPAAPAVLEQLRASSDVTGQRRHAWQLFAGITSPAADGRPIWETWYSRLDTFQVPGKTATAAGRRASLVSLRQARLAPGDRLVPPSDPHLSDILFNRPAYDHIRRNKLYLKSTLAKLNAAFPPGTPLWSRAIPEFPAQSVVLKVVYWPVKRDGMTPMPVWDFAPVNRYSPATPLPSNPQTSWARVVAIDPGRSSVPPGTVADIFYNNRLRPKSSVVPLDSFYRVELDAGLVAMMKQNRYFMDSVDMVFGKGRTIEPGDWIVVAAVHITTKEIPAWVWATAWWHDKPNDGPLAVGRPNAIEGVWRNYLMDTTFDPYLPVESDGSPNITYNPWMEGVEAGGIQSNCGACHSRATYPGVSSDPATRGLNDPFYNAPIFPGGKDPAFDGSRLMLDALWSIYIESYPPVVPHPRRPGAARKAGAVR
jgi:hypothetical protein